MKITSKVLSIPPYMSTTWNNISSMHVKEEAGTFRLIVLFKDGPQVEIPSLSRDTVTSIFNAHAQYAEETSVETVPPQKILEETPLTFTLPATGDRNTIEAFGPTAEHNPNQSNLPPLPPGVLKKITAIASAFGVDSLSSMAKAEPGCNCIYCQVMKALQGEQELEIEEEITAEDLKFRNWEVKQTADKLYVVTNPLDLNEHYSVFLGEPIGCTCGIKGCEHVRAVLSS